ncbi:hypothetical protein VSU19_21800 [Verrucomicrobiales bacterium BCK34]|nr:hypothetical protein [Verrucomicrobiales bacterium BCK34]
MKGFLGTLLVICGLIAAGWFCYEPYIKPLLEGSPTMTDDSVIPDKPTVAEKPEESAPAAKPKAVAKPKEVAAKPKPKTELEQFLEKRYPMPEILPLETIVDGWRNVPPNAYPKAVTSTETIAFDLVVDGQKIGSSNLSPGTELKPVRLVGDQLTITSLANPAMNEVLPVEKTDFKQRITARYNEFVAYKTDEVEKKRATAKAALEKNPERLAVLLGKAPAKVDSSGDPRIGPVKASLRNGEAASVTLEEAKSFTYNGTETIGGEFAGTYETVTVNFEVTTIFGKFPTEYKALLKGGKVHAWIDPITDDRI